MKPNVLFFILDSLRADKCFGPNKTSKTPNIDALLENGVSFHQAITTVCSTIPSFASIFTACYPFKIGMGGKAYQKLEPKIFTYVKKLNEFGYHTHVIFPKLLEPSGIMKDFDDKMAYADNSRLSSGLDLQIINKLDSIKRNEPWFCIIHLIDLHEPILVPKEYDEKFGENQYERMVSVIDSWIGKILQQINLKKTLVVLSSDHGDIIQHVQKNGQEIKFEPNFLQRVLWKIGPLLPKFLFPIKYNFHLKIDDMVKQRKLSKLKKYNLSPYEIRSLLGSRLRRENTLYDESLRIPLIFSYYSIKSKIKIFQQVRNIDIFPTIMEILGLPANENIDGQSLVPLFHGKKLEASPIYLRSAPEIKTSVEHMCGIRTSEYKYFRSIDNPKDNVHLFNLKNDPFEETNLANTKSDIVKKMEKILTEIQNNLLNEPKLNKKTKPDEETKKIEDELKKLGYI